MSPTWFVVEETVQHKSSCMKTLEFQLERLGFGQK